jgi:hypothetical protein
MEYSMVGWKRTTDCNFLKSLVIKRKYIKPEDLSTHSPILLQEISYSIVSEAK